MKKNEEEILFANFEDLAEELIYEKENFSYTKDSFQFKKGKGFKRILINKNRVKRTALNNYHSRGYNNLLFISISGVTDRLVNKIIPFAGPGIICLIKSFGQLNYNVYHDKFFGAELEFQFKEKLICVSVNPTKYVNVFWDGIPTIIE